MQIYLVDAFTTHRFSGNPAGVVLDADNLSNKDKQLIASEIHASETAFISKSTLADFKVQFFTPTTEINFCGHATVATFYTLVKAGKIDLKEIPLHLTEETLAGIVPITVSRHTNGLLYVTMTQSKLQTESAANIRKDIACALKIQENKLDDRFPLMFANTGNCHLLVGVSPDTLNLIDYDAQALSNILSSKNAVTAHVFANCSNGQFQARNFCPTVGIPEDPATGSAAGAFGAYLAHIGFTSMPMQEFSIVQGEKMGRPSQISIQVFTEDGIFQKVQVSGTAVTSFKLLEPDNLAKNI